MLANILALAVGLGSLALYLAAFFFPEVHRKNDFLWSGVGLFYALVLWFCARQITGAVLLGQFACVILLGALGWQLVTLRRSITPTDLQTPVSVESFNQSTTETVSQIKTNLRTGSWRKALPKLAVRVKESLQFGFDNSSANRLSRLARARSASKRKVKRRYEYEFVEDAPRDRRVQAAVNLSPETEMPEAAITPLETPPLDLPEIPVAPAPSADTSMSVQLGKASLEEAAELQAGRDVQDTSKTAAPRPNPDELAGMQAVKEQSEESVVAGSAVNWGDPVGAAETATNEENWGIEEIDESIPDEWNAVEALQSNPPPSASSIKQPPTNAFEKVIILKDWMKELIASFTRPKPKYSMIELPPRPPSIPRPPSKSGVVQEAETDKEFDDEFDDEEFEAVLEELDGDEKPESSQDDVFSAAAADFGDTAEISPELEDSDRRIKTEASVPPIGGKADSQITAGDDAELSDNSAVDETGDVVNRTSP